ncbi:MAG: hypothetical protein ACK5RS_14915 [Acidobacteriota bacterium]
MSWQARRGWRPTSGGKQGGRKGIPLFPPQLTDREQERVWAMPPLRTPTASRGSEGLASLLPEKLSI